MTVWQWLVLAAILLVSLGVPVWMLALLIRGGLSDHHNSTGNAGGWSALTELDQLTRPSMEHVQQANDPVIEQEDHDGS